MKMDKSNQDVDTTDSIQNSSDDSYDTLNIGKKFEAIRINENRFSNETMFIPTEVPLTLIVNEQEIGTIACSPRDIKEFILGFLFTSGFVNNCSEVISFWYDKKTWSVDVQISRIVDPLIVSKRLYTSGCGKGVMFSNINELSLREPLTDEFRIDSAEIAKTISWFQSNSRPNDGLGGIHCAAASVNKEFPELVFYDIGRHNAVDKVIGRMLSINSEFSLSVIYCTGRASSEIVLKARKSMIPIVVSLGLPTHQAILLAKQTGVTLIGQARKVSYVIFTCNQRVIVHPS